MWFIAEATVELDLTDRLRIRDSDKRRVSSEPEDEARLSPCAPGAPWDCCRSAGADAATIALDWLRAKELRLAELGGDGRGDVSLLGLNLRKAEVKTTSTLISWQQDRFCGSRLTSLEIRV